MGRLTLKTLERNNLPFGKFSFKVDLARETKRTYFSASNASQIEAMRDMLRTTCVGDHKLVWATNSKGKRVYLELYLTNSMDLAMLKLVHADKLFKIYKIKVVDTPE